MRKIIILIGISGAGKSNWAINYIKENPNTIRINRDDIRKTLVGTLSGYYQRKDLNTLERMVSFGEEDIFNSGQWADYDIIVDNTNLKQSYINKFIELAQRTNYTIHFKLFDIDLKEAKDRVFKRDFGPSEEDKTAYIDKQFKQYQEIKKYILTQYKDWIL